MRVAFFFTLFFRLYSPIFPPASFAFHKPASHQFTSQRSSILVEAGQGLVDLFFPYIVFLVQKALTTYPRTASSFLC